MSKEQFNQFKFKFTSELDPVKMQTINFDYTSEHFSKVTDEQAISLFKMAAHRQISTLVDKQKIVATSLKYQVLSEHTALIGVVKQMEKPVRELKVYDQMLKPE